VNSPGNYIIERERENNKEVISFLHQRNDAKPVGKSTITWGMARLILLI
jgi:hypothetical protein